MRKRELSKQGWRLQKTLRELQEWSDWTAQSLENFNKELGESADGLRGSDPAAHGLTVIQVDASSRVRNGISDMLELTKRMEKELRKAFGRRIRRKAV
jgi:hypothetical protein